MCQLFSDGRHLQYNKLGALLCGQTKLSIHPAALPSLLTVDATNRPPGRSTREISASAAEGLGQQWMAAPACSAATV